jgi:hypothetical protein
MLDMYSRLDDFDVFASIKVWSTDDDPVLRMLCTKLTQRNLPAIEISNEPFDRDYIQTLYKAAATQLNISEQDASYFVFSDSVTNKAYSPEGFSIKVLYRNGLVKDIAEASDQYNITALTQPVRKYFLCYPKK